MTAAREAERILSNQYLAGTVPYTSFVVAQTAALNDAEAALDVKQSQLLAAVSLIEALGGGWDASQLPSRERLNESPRSISTRCRRRSLGRSRNPSGILPSTIEPKRSGIH